jgi:hypothetical protein
MTRFDLGKDRILVQAGLLHFHLVQQRNHMLQLWTDRVLVVVWNHMQGRKDGDFKEAEKGDLLVEAEVQIGLCCLLA